MSDARMGLLRNRERVQPVIDKCREQLDAGRDFVILSLDHRDPPTGETTMLLDWHGPRGYILNYLPQSQTIVARFKASKVIKALETELAERER